MTWRHLIVPALALAPLGATASSTQTSSLSTGKTIFQVKVVEGDVLAYPLFTMGWTQVRRGMRFPQGTLLQLYTGARIVITEVTARGSQSSAAPRTLTATATNPMALRLDPDMERQIVVKDVTVGRLAPAGHSPSSEDSRKPETAHKPAIRQLEEAWTRLRANVSTDTAIGFLKTTTHLLTNTPDLSIQADILPLRVILPPQGASVNLAELSGYLPILWEGSAPLRQGGNYQVFFWKEGATPSTPIGVTDATKYEARVKDPGRYLFQIATADGSRRSSVRVITVLKDMHSAIAADTALPELIQPVSGSVVIGRTHFIWRSAAMAPDGCSWHIKSTAGKSGPRVGTTVNASGSIPHRSNMYLDLTPGRYSWNIACTSPGNPSVATEAQQFTVAQAKDWNFGKLLLTAKTSGQSETVYFSE